MLLLVKAAEWRRVESAVGGLLKRLLGTAGQDLVVSALKVKPKSLFTARIVNCIRFSG